MAEHMKDAYIVAAVRTPVAKRNGHFKTTRADDLLAHVLSEVKQQVPDLHADKIDDVVIGCAMPEGEQGMNVARMASLLANYPDSVPAYTVNRFCASGLQAIAIAADQIALGHSQVVVAGGIESMSRVPMGGHRYSANPKWFEEDEARVGMAFSMGITAEKVAQKWRIAREAQDEFALSSHQKALDAIQRGDFKAEIVPFRARKIEPNLHFRSMPVVEWHVTEDEGPRKDTSLEALAKLKPVFSRTGTVTPGNTSQMSDGAAALMLVSEDVLNQYDLTPLARFKGMAVAGVSPEYMGIGPVEAISTLLKRQGQPLSQIDWIELNEAFAAQALAVIQELDLDPTKVNPLGGAIALGHPLGATGAIKATTLVHAMRRHQLKHGVVSMCIGTGMGAAGLFEAL